MASLKGSSMNWEIVQINGLNTISPTNQCSIHEICSNTVNFHIVASDFIIVAELTSEIALKSTQRSALFHQSRSIVPHPFSVDAFYLNEKLPPFHIPHILWFRECWCLLSSFPALCQEARNFFTLLHGPRQYHSRLSFKRPKRTGEKRLPLSWREFWWPGNWGCAWMGWLNVRHSLLGLEDRPKEGRKCKSNHTWEVCTAKIVCTFTCPLVFKIITPVIFSAVHLSRQKRVNTWREDRIRPSGIGLMKCLNTFSKPVGKRAAISRQQHKEEVEHWMGSLNYNP